MIAPDSLSWREGRGSRPWRPFEVVEVRDRRGVDAVDLLGLAESPDLSLRMAVAVIPVVARRASPTAVGSGVPLLVVIT